MCDVQLFDINSSDSAIGTSSADDGRSERQSTVSIFLIMESSKHGIMLNMEVHKPKMPSA